MIARLCVLVPLLASPAWAQLDASRASEIATGVGQLVAVAVFVPSLIAVGSLKHAQRPVATTCSTDSDCSESHQCEANQCVRRAEKGLTQRDEAAALYLAAHAVELREELGLGRGPVIDVLAAVRGRPPDALGRALKANRAALRALMGDGSDPTWSSRFLRHLDTLS